MKGPNIEIEIEELVLHGFSHRDRYAIADAVERELSHLLAARFAERSIPSSLAHNAVYASIDAGGFQVTPNASTGAIGVQIAQTVNGGLLK